MFGKVTNLNGFVQQKLTIEASPDLVKNNSAEARGIPTEIATTDTQGNFRIRGLSPNLHYNIDVRGSDFIKYIRPSTW